MHCLVLLDCDTQEIKTFGPCEIDEGVKILAKADQIIGHNVIGYDIPVLNRLYGGINPQKALDTLIISRMMYPDKASTPWVVTLLMIGVSILVFTNNSMTWDGMRLVQTMLDYCIQDVKVSYEIYKSQQQFVKENNKSVKLRTYYFKHYCKTNRDRF